MTGSLILIPVLSTLACWLVTYLTARMFVYPLAPKKIFGITFHGIVPARTGEITDRLIEAVSRELRTDANVQQKFINNTQLDFLMPEIEKHIDDFLRHRLGKKMPMIGMFIGETTIRQLKEVFMDELKEILPSIMQGYINGLVQQDDFRKYVRERMTMLDVSAWKSAVSPAISRDIRFISLIGGGIGLIVGLIQVLVVVSVYKPK